jgi:hydrogenase large subunit
MYRGFENIMLGRSPLDGLVITPRICGICSTSHLYAAAKALDMAYGVQSPVNANLIRNITRLVEILQNDFRHTFLLYMPDFTDPAYQDHPLYSEVFKRYAPLKGSTVRQAIEETQKILEIISIIGGQWPHSSFMIPGGVVYVPSTNELNRCAFLLDNFKQWYQNRILGCSLETWQEIQSKNDLMGWLESDSSHQQSDLGCYLRFAGGIGLEDIGGGHGNFIRFGMPENESLVKGGTRGDAANPFSGGFYGDGGWRPLMNEKITEDVSHAWFLGEDGGRHPYEGQTKPYGAGNDDRKYSWSKAPRYDGRPAETGPLAEMIIGKNPLFLDYLKEDGPSAFLRQLARLARAATVIPMVEDCLRQAAIVHGKYCNDHGELEHESGHGLVEAPRGALGHWVKMKNHKISSYQIITPTAWNASPRDFKEVRGPWEEALIGTPVKDTENPIEIHHIVRSFDPCLVCTVHAIDTA